MRTRWLVSLALVSALGCGSRSSSPGGAALAIAGATRATPSPTGAAAAGSTAAPSSRAAPLAPLDLARAVAPLFKFNAWVPNDSSPHNKSEDHFPMSVAGFLDEVASGKARVCTQEADKATPGINEVRPFTGKVVVEDDKIEGYPKLMAGDAPGTAPIYVHVYEDTTKRKRNPDGSGEDFHYVECWIFYPQDVSKVRFASVAVSFAGHRSDWEHLTIGAALVYGPGGAFVKTEVRQGLFYGHNDKFSCDASECELVDDQGRPTPSGTHVVAYVALGKHAAYPQAGSWRDRFGAPPLAGEDDVFRGNGAEWRTWQTPIHDLEGPPTPEFTRPSFTALLAPSLAAKGLADWRAYEGHWGPDKILPLIPFTASPKGPRAKPNEYGSGDKYSELWHDVKQSHAHQITLGQFPAVVPPPVPLRR